MLLRCGTHGVLRRIGPRRAGEIADNAFIGDRLMKLARIFEATAMLQFLRRRLRTGRMRQKERETG